MEKVKALLTDLYQLTMGGGYFQLEKINQEVVFDYFFRRNPFGGGYTVFAGLEKLIKYLINLKFSEEEVRYLRSLKIFPEEFLDYLLNEFRFRGDVYAVPEGTVVFPNTPIVRVKANILEAQLIETSLLNILNFPTLIATKAARICQAAEGATVLEFGLRRAPEDGALSATRAAIIGGCQATSNVEGARIFNVPPKGTQAHSWIQSFPSELEAFRAYARVYPHNCLLLVDTYDTLESGVPNAIKVFQELQKKGYRPLGIRIDSGDLAYLTVEARKMLDEAGFEETIIVLSNDLDEYVITQIIDNIKRIWTEPIIREIEEKINNNQLSPEEKQRLKEKLFEATHQAIRTIKKIVYGVGTALVTGKGESALGGVYKLVAAEENKKLIPKIKISGNPEKITNPGLKELWRVYKNGQMIADVISLAGEDLTKEKEIPIFHPQEIHKHTVLRDFDRIEKILRPIIRKGKLVYDLPPLLEIQKRTQQQLSQLHLTCKRLLNPHIYWVSLTREFWELRQKMTKERR